MSVIVSSSLVSDIADRDRFLLYGFPLSGKSFSMRTFVEDDTQQVKVLVMPGEKGVKSLPRGNNIQWFTFRQDKPESMDARQAKEQAEELVFTVYRTTREILRGKHGQVDLLLIDGLHKQHIVELNAVTEGKYGRGIPFEERGTYTTRLYGPAHTRFSDYLADLYESEVPRIVCTAWAGYEQPRDNMSAEAQMQAQRHGALKIWPAIPGAMAKGSIGEFDGIIYCGFITKAECSYPSCRKEKEAHETLHRVWQLQAKGDVVGVGIRNYEGKPLPIYVHQDWTILRKLLQGG